MAESAEEVIYVVDASSWISIDGNPDANRILSHLDKLIERGRIKCPPQALNEVRNAYMAGWIKARRKQISHSLRSKVEFLALLGQVTFQFAGMSGARGKRNRADPYLVAYSAYRNKTENPTKCVVSRQRSGQTENYQPPARPLASNRSILRKCLGVSFPRRAGEAAIFPRLQHSLSGGARSLLPPNCPWRATRNRKIELTHCKHWCRLRGLNSRPSVYKTAALPLS